MDFSLVPRFMTQRIVLIIGRNFASPLIRMLYISHWEPEICSAHSISEQVFKHTRLIKLSAKDFFVRLLAETTQTPAENNADAKI